MHLKAMRKRLFAAALGGLLLVLAGILVLAQADRLERFLQLLEHMSPLWVAVALMFQLGTYFSLATLWKLAFLAGSVDYPLRALMPLAVAKLFADQALPTGGISGMAFFVAALKGRNINTTLSMGVLMVSILSWYAAFVIVAITALLLLWLYHEIHYWILIASTLFFVIAIAIPSAMLFLRYAEKKEFPSWISHFPALPELLSLYGDVSADMVSKPLLLVQATILQMVIVVLDVATLWAMLQALGDPVTIFHAFPSFVMASMVAMVSLIPLGLGTFESTCTLLLVMQGVPLETAITGTLLLRGFTLWLPMVPGLWLTHRELG